jgi:hypothetical protein
MKYKKNKMIIHDPSGKTIEMEVQENGMTRPTMMIMPDGKIYLEYDLKKMGVYNQTEIDKE